MSFKISDAERTTLRVLAEYPGDVVESGVTHDDGSGRVNSRHLDSLYALHLISMIDGQPVVTVDGYRILQQTEGAA